MASFDSLTNSCVKNRACSETSAAIRSRRSRLRAWGFGALPEGNRNSDVKQANARQNHSWQNNNSADGSSLRVRHLRATKEVFRVIVFCPDCGGELRVTIL